MRIGELAAATGVSARSLRYYEQQGLISSERTPSGQRIYAESVVSRVTFLQRLFSAGLSSRTIRNLLPCIDTPSEESTAASLDTLVRERDRLVAHIDDLVYTRGRLEQLIEANLDS
uniref:MerR family transcriptional regulator n=1 Tax=Paractinoplanes polyasparticus TaxID=2856853 RepID=UPI001C84822C|nr:MerR family transcriptional regulator [Actinoplanes polyasparticus]